MRQIFNLILQLVDVDKEDVGEGDGLFRVRVERIMLQNSYKELSYQFRISNVSYLNKPIRWQFVCLCIDLLKMVNLALKSTRNEKERVLNSNEEQLLKSCITLVVCLGMFPYLMPRLMPPPVTLCKTWNLLKPEDITELEKHRRLKYTTMSLLELYYERMLYQYIVPDFLNEMLCAFCQFCFAPLKKPVSSVDETSSDISEMISEINLKQNLEGKCFVMTPEIWIEVQNDRQNLQIEFKNFLDHLYQPLVMRHIMFLMLRKEKMPKCMWRALCTLLHNRITRHEGVKSVIRTICDNNFELLSDSSKLDQITTLFIGVFSSSPEECLNSVVPQLLDILRHEGDDDYAEAYRRVGVLSISRLYETDDDFARTRIIYRFMQPLLYPSATATQDEIRQCVIDLYRCFVLPGNSTWSLPCDLLSPVVRPLFSIYRLFRAGRRDNDNIISDSNISNVDDLYWMVRKLLEKYFTDLYEDNIGLLSSTLYDLVFQWRMKNLTIELSSDNNGVVFVYDDNNNNNNSSNNDLSVNEQASTDLIEFLTNFGGTDGKKMIGIYFFKLLENFCDCLITSTESINGTENLNVILNLLESIIRDDRLPVITFKSILQFLHSIRRFFVKFSSPPVNDTRKRILHACLMIVYVMLEKMEPLTSQDKLSEYDFLKLITPFEHSGEYCYDVATGVLAKQLRGKFTEMSKTADNVNKLPVEEQSPYRMAFNDAHHESIPIRTAGLAKLIKLYKEGDPETTANYCTLFCLFDENLRNPSTFLLARAVDGLAIIIADLPELFLSKFCKNYVECRSFHLKLKIGETLAKIIRYLGNTGKLKHQKVLLLNTLFSSLRSFDHLVRASALSNMADICRLLNFNLKKVAPEILDIIIDIIKFDPAIECKRAGVHLLSSFIKGLSMSTSEVPTDLINRLKLLLQHLYESDEDSAIRLHAQVGLECITESMNDRALSYE